MTKRIPSLDGLRAVAIAGVILSHTGTLLRPRGTWGAEASRLIHAVELGPLGVRLFFVLSGFLISRGLLRDLDRTGTIDLRDFYWRRTLRIFPPYYALIGLTLLSAAFGWQHVASGNLWHALTYTSDYDPHPTWPLGHAWSLAVEEQFYVLWPVALVLLGRTRGLWFAAASCALAPLLRLAWVGGGVPWSGYGQVGFTFETVADALATGCLLAGLRDTLWGQRWYRALLGSRAFTLVPLAALGVAAIHGRPIWSQGVGVTVMNVAIALTLDAAMRYPASRAGKVLNWAPMAWLGTISYSLYLWQQPFLNSKGILAGLPVSVLLALILAFACASYYGVERPVLAWRDRRWPVPRTTTLTERGPEAGAPSRDLTTTLPER